MLEENIPPLNETGRRWIRFGVLLAVLVLLVWLVFSLRTVFTPIVIAAVVAYILNPLVSWLERRTRASRLSLVAIVFSVVIAGGLVGGVLLGSSVLGQLARLRENVDTYVAVVGDWAERLQLPTPHAGATTTAEPATPANDEPLTVAAEAPESAPATAPSPGIADWWPAMAPLLREHWRILLDTLLAAITRTFTSLSTLVSLLFLVPLFSFYFLWRFDDLVRTIHDHLPAKYRATVVDIVTTIDGAVANFFRGRLIVCALVGLITGFGWTLVGVPYGLALGLLAGLLNIVPFMSLLALPPALFFTFYGHFSAHENWVLAVALTAAVYMAVQALESFLLSPTIEGQASGLHPLAIVLAIMIGAELAGLLGMLLAIPVASTLRTFSMRLLLPEIRRWAAGPAAPTTIPPAEPPADSPSAVATTPDRESK